MTYKEHIHSRSERQLAWRREFAEAAKMCSAKVKGLPKGEKLSCLLYTSPSPRDS